MISEDLPQFNLARIVLRKEKSNLRFWQAAAGVFGALTLTAFLNHGTAAFIPQHQQNDGGVAGSHEVPKRPNVAVAAIFRDEPKK